MNRRFPARVYELRRGGWVELDQRPRARSGGARLATLLAGAFALAATTAIVILALALTVLFLPAALIVSLIRRT